MLRHIRLPLLLAASAALGLACLAATAQESPSTAPRPHAASLVTAGQYDMARDVVRAQFGGSPDAALHMAHLEGLIALEEGQLEQAITIFRGILAMEPGFVPARMALADALARVGEHDAALHHYEQLALLPDEGIRTVAANRIDAVRAARPYGISGYVSVSPSSNANRGSGHETFTAGGYQFVIDPDSRATSGIGLGAGMDGFAEMRLDAERSVRVSVGADVVKYLETDAFDTLQLSASLAFEQQLGLASFSVGPTVIGHWSGWDYGLTRYGIAGSGQLPVGRSNLVALSFSALAQDYELADYRDGYRIGAQGRLIHQFNAAHRGEISLGRVDEVTQRPHLDHTDYTAGIALASEWPGGLMTDVFADYEFHEFAGTFPGTNAPRADHRVSAGITLAHRNFEIGGFVPELTYRYTRQFSNVSFFDYDSHDMGASLTREF